MAIGEGLCGGYLPLGAAAVAGRVVDAIYARFDSIAARRPFVGHATACGAGVAVQRIIDREGLLEKVRDDGRYLFAALRSVLQVDERVGDVRGRGFYVGIELVSEPISRTPFDPELRVHERIRERALENRLICQTLAPRSDGSAGDHIVLSPPFNASRAELDEIVEKLSRTVGWVLRTLHS
jgi:adenosylmethionine-8-amino-7-oxononanoate aminotransferase